VANTKNITDCSERKKAKRDLRKKLKETFTALTPAEKTQFRKSETGGLRKWIDEQSSEG
jgi:hypothetical protein